MSTIYRITFMSQVKNFGSVDWPFVPNKGDVVAILDDLHFEVTGRRHTGFFRPEDNWSVAYVNYTLTGHEVD